ncbi:MAG: hypothetical protein M1836_005034 [Candelina mexicana]|nr:MAG: hypothetical protein M1836_005034 [Candelina mexicana]
MDILAAKPQMGTTEKSTDTATDTWFRFLIKRTLLNKAQVGRDLDYEWLKLNIFTRWDSSTKGTVVIMFDTRPDIKARLLSLLFDAINPIRLGDPYFHHVLIAEEVLNLQNEAAWSIRDSVRHVELARTAFPDFPRLHDLARHAIHVVETLDLAARTLDSMIMHHDRFASATIATYGTIQTTQHLINDRLHFYKEAIHGLRLRSISNKDRLLNEIQFSFNVATQNIASATMKINQAVQSDSSAMKTVALLTAVFIPLTYIATLFSMSFFGFNTDSGKWHISNKFWMYWAVSIPFTSAAAIFMYLYHWMFTSQKSNSY